jgi:putative (di)nucleoside polyphosphate hydrolase
MTERPDRNAMPYRDCVGVAVFNPRGEVFIGRRMPDESLEDKTEVEAPWQMPQGGIDKGEDPLDAAYRELYEETGIKTVTLLAEARDWINYDLPPALIGIGLRGKFRGQTQRWFAFRFDGDDSEIAINPPPGGHEPEFDAWEWKPMQQLPGLIVPFKRAVYDQVVAEFQHLVTLQSED